MDLSPDDQPAPQPPSDPMASIVPYKNPPALTSYYLGLFSIFPVLGLFMGVAALVLGTKGMKMVREHPEAKGKAHAGIGIGCGLIGLLFNLAIIIIFVGAFLSRSQPS